jgi:hypothetical protein
VPDDGPGSGCPIGYAYSERLNCCVETPGNDGSECPDDDGQTGGLITFAAAPTNYDYGQGYCDPPDGQQCPEGYMFNEQLNGCVPTSTENTNGLIQTECPDGTTYDPQLGYCVQDQCGCPLGTYMNTDTNECVPYGETGEQDGCWTYEVSVPVCEYVPPDEVDCPEGETYQPSTGQCVREELNCYDIGNQQVCQNAGCNWNCTSTPYICSLGPSYGAQYACQP